jgi:hypothetical protein
MKMSQAKNVQVSGTVPHNVVERDQQLSTQIDETVKMSKYKIKRTLEAARVIAQDNYEAKQEAWVLACKPRKVITDRVMAAAKEYALTALMPMLNLLVDYCESGESGTFFDDNRDEEVPLETIANKMVYIEHSYGMPSANESQSIWVWYYVNVFAHVSSNAGNLGDYEDILMTPKHKYVTIPLTPEETAIIALGDNLSSEKHLFNLEINEIDTKLKNLDNITEDIEFALLQSKAKSEGNTQVTDVSDQITKAILAGENPSVMLLK